MASDSDPAAASLPDKTPIPQNPGEKKAVKANRRRESGQHALGQSTSDIVSDLFLLLKANKGKSLLAVVGSALFGGMSWWNASTVSVDVSPKTSDMAKYGAVTPDMYCAEQLKFNQQLNAYFARQANPNGASNPDFRLSAADCKALLEKQAAAPAAPR